MKRILSILLVVFTMFFSLSVAEVKAANKQTSNRITIFEDGSYIKIELNTGSQLTRGNISGNKTYTYYDGANDIMWEATVTGNFTYDGRYASCTSSRCTVTVYDSAWSTISKTAWVDENIAKATVEMARKMLGVTVKQVTYNLSLVCDRYGNLS